MIHRRSHRTEPGAERDPIPDELWESLAGPVTDTRQPQELFGDETLEQALRQLTLYGRHGLPVISNDRRAPPRLDHPPRRAPARSSRT